MKNINDLNEHLFAQLERLSDPEVDMNREYTRSRAMVDVSSAIIQSGKLILEAERFHDDRNDADALIPKFFDTNNSHSVIDNG